MASLRQGPASSQATAATAKAGGTDSAAQTALKAPLANPDHGLHLAIAYGKVGAVEQLLNTAAAGGTLHALLNTVDSAGDTPLHIAAKYNKCSEMRLLLAAGASVRSTNKRGSTPLHLAAAAGHAGPANQLLEAANMNVYGSHYCLTLVDSGGFSAWQLAVYYNRLSVVQVMTANLEGPLVVTLFHIERVLPTAVSRGHKHLVQHLLATCTQLSAKSNQKPLLSAVRSGCTELVRHLLLAGSTTNDADLMGDTALHMAVIYDEEKSARLLLAAGADPNAPTLDGATPTYLAAHHGRLEMLQMLVAAGGNVNAVRANGTTALHTAIMAPNCQKIVKYLVQAGANFNIPYVDLHSQHMSTALHLAAGHANTAALASLVAAGAAINATDSDGNTPLHLAVKLAARSTHNISQLLSAGAALDAANKAGQTPLCIAATAGQQWALEQLLQAGAKVSDASGHDGPGAQLLTHPLWLAAMNMRAAAFEILVRHPTLDLSKLDVGRMLAAVAGWAKYSGRFGPMVQLAREVCSRGGDGVPLARSAIAAAGNRHFEAVVTAILQQFVQDAIAVCAAAQHAALLKQRRGIQVLVLGYGSCIARARASVKTDAAQSASSHSSQYLQGLQQMLATACENGETEEVQALLEAGAPVNSHSQPSCTPTALYKATVMGCTAMVKQLLAAGALPSSTEGKAAVMSAAATNGHAAVLKLLLTAFGVGSWDQHMLMTTAARGHKQVTDVLQDQLALDTFTVSDITTAAEKALLMGHLDVFAVLMKHLMFRNMDPVGLRYWLTSIVEKCRCEGKMQAFAGGVLALLDMLVCESSVDAVQRRAAECKSQKLALQQMIIRLGDLQQQSVRAMNSTAGSIVKRRRL